VWLPSRAVFAPVLLTCYAITVALHVGSIALSTLLPFRMVDVGGTSTQVGLLFSVMTMVSMVLRPAIGGWVDRLGAHWVLVPGVAALAVTSLALQVVATPAALIGAVVDRLSYGPGFVVAAVGAALGTLALACIEVRRRPGVSGMIESR
jgi:MFS family permease